MGSLTISGLAASAGVGVETVRFYQRKGLLVVPDVHRGFRRYDAGAVRQLRFIRKAQAAGFTLAEIARLLELDSSNDRADARALAEKRLAAIETQIAALEEARRALGRLTHACAHGSSGPCPIIQAFEEA